MKQNVFQIGLNALANSSRTAVDETQLMAILLTGDGPGHLVRALFEDCSLESLDRMAMEAGLSRQRLFDSYRVAKARHGARNEQLEPENSGL